MKDDYKIRIFQPNVRPYRIGLFEGIGCRYPKRVELCAAPFFDSTLPSCALKGVEMDYTHPYVVTKVVRWQRGFSIEGLKKGDVVVIAGEPRNLSMMRIAMLARSHGIGVLWWGLHKMPNQKWLTLRIRKWIMTRLADTVLFYNKAGVDWMRNEGDDISHVFATGNTINQAPIKDAIKAWTPEKLLDFKRKNDLIGKRIVLSCSRIIEKQRLHEAIVALAQTPLNRPDTILVVIGDGPLKDECVSLAKKEGVSDRIRWLGAIYDEHEMAPWFLSARAFTYPGPVGLAILKALSYGLPAVINDTHNSTEAEIMENGKTGMLFKENDTYDLSSVLDELMKDEERWRKMSEYSQKVAFENYSMDQMVDNFCAALEDAHKQAMIKA